MNTCVYQYDEWCAVYHKKIVYFLKCSLIFIYIWQLLLKKGLCYYCSLAKYCVGFGKPYLWLSINLNLMSTNKNKWPTILEKVFVYEKMFRCFLENCRPYCISAKQTNGLELGSHISGNIRDIYLNLVSTNNQMTKTFYNDTSAKQIMAYLWKY